jgi:aerobic-type carbon monoxide dehydrogenase small subunit (CoxS/CutS family)
MRIENHPILEFEKKEKVEFFFNDELVYGYEGDTIASALHALNVKVLGQSVFKHRPRGFFCAIGNCSSCNMTVDGEVNVKTCIVPLKKNMKVYTQNGLGEVKW